MKIHDEAIAKIRQLPEPLAKEVSDFVDFLVLKNDANRWQDWLHFAEAQQLNESDLHDYLRNLEAYETDLANGKIQW